MLDLDFKKAQELVAEAIASKGDGFVYEKADGISCQYVHGITQTWDDIAEEYENDYSTAVTGCLVGDALKRGGIPIEVLGNEYVNDSGSDELLSTLQDKDFLRVSERARYYLSDVQASQDYGVPWGKANELALEGKQFRPVLDEGGEPTGEFREYQAWTEEKTSDVPH
ncbi:hypothetical protein SEA_ROMERO_76 [Streptomyces phage Romero]|uniref:Uncharacterized protein n=2 Tax=Immanueltrevirus immanuel3 TaxID=2846399 RepID=A0A2H5BMG1_9CAUD|nr:hypothetical protein HWB41_gp24 [Streptomyces phage Immanuel3]ATW69425.1 hypothetical protein SEA_IMMANUEL3_74 [Streptomyces phage Immanuel3]AUG87508.1 hypothetical protein SEA_ROMERO_76 [Streptomyces phage Romero]